MILTIGTLLALMVGAAVVTLTVITYKKIRDYLKQKRLLKNSSTRFVARYKAGDYETINIGIWDTEANSVSDPIILKGKATDDETRHYLPAEEVILLDL